MSDTMEETQTKRYPFIILRQIYNKCLEWADHHHNTKALSLVAFIEAVFFPIPVDVMLLPMGASRPRKAIWYALLATLFSVLGAIVGYGLGYGFWEVTKDFFLSYVISPDHFNWVVSQFQENAFLAIFAAGFTPIPYKVFAIAGGVAHISLSTFIIASVFGRGLRFLLLGSLLYFSGEKIKEFIEAYFEKITSIVTVLLIIAVVLLKYYF